MSDIRVAFRYAKSLLQLSMELDKVEQSYKDMMLIRSVCSENKDLELLLKSPVVKSYKKLNILKEIFAKQLGELTFSFLKIITSKKRENLLVDIVDQYIQAYKTHKNIRVANVVTAIPLNDELRKEIPQLIKNTMTSNDNIELVEEVDANLIGGMVLRVGDKQIDQSIRKQLLKLEMEFSKNPYQKKY